jgi:hypothetical protein
MDEETVNALRDLKLRAVRAEQKFLAHLIAIAEMEAIRISAADNVIYLGDWTRGSRNN